jgi:hypothetical protein
MMGHYLGKSLKGKADFECLGVNGTILSKNTGRWTKSTNPVIPGINICLLRREQS